MPAPHTRRGESPSSFSQSGAWTSSTPLPSFSLLSSGPQEPSTTRLVALRNRRRVCQSAFELPSARPTLQSLSHLLVILPPWAAVCQGVISSGAMDDRLPAVGQQVGRVPYRPKQRAAE